MPSPFSPSLKPEDLPSESDDWLRQRLRRRCGPNVPLLRLAWSRIAEDLWWKRRVAGGVLVFEHDAGSGDFMWVLLGQAGVVVVGFDRRSAFSPYRQPEGCWYVDGLFADMPPALRSQLDAFIEPIRKKAIRRGFPTEEASPPISFARWRLSGGRWEKGTEEVVLEDDEEPDDGGCWLLGSLPSARNGS